MRKWWHNDGGVGAKEARSEGGGRKYVKEREREKSDEVGLM